MSKPVCTSILLAGVGGQGILLGSQILGEVALISGYDVKQSEVHGMAQRGGSVVSHVKFGTKVYSPLICEDEADFIFAFEYLEALRYIDYLKKGGIVIVNDQKIIPLTAQSGEVEYPKDIEPYCLKKASKFILVSGLKLAQELGNIRAVNVIMLGAIANFLEFPEKNWYLALENVLPSKILSINRKAFKMGMDFSIKFKEVAKT
jgi:indolepyruvate ferredoxin oxidoreductase, beta subunit